MLAYLGQKLLNTGSAVTVDRQVDSGRQEHVKLLGAAGNTPEALLSLDPNGYS